jgi:hypothetical protein
VLANEPEPVIPSKSNRRTPIDYDKALYKERVLVERFFNKLKQFRRVAIRYDKLLANYRDFVILAAITITTQIIRHYRLGGWTNSSTLFFSTPLKRMPMPRASTASSKNGLLGPFERWSGAVSVIGICSVYVSVW